MMEESGLVREHHETELVDEVFLEVIDADLSMSNLLNDLPSQVTE
jgi:hypothetical protein